MQFSNALSSLSMALVLLVSNPAHSTEIETFRGPVTISEEPKKIAVFDIPAIDTLDALGVSIAGVPNNLFLDELKAKFKSVETVGSLFEPDLEALNGLEPDLIIVGGRSAKTLDQVSRVGTSIDMTVWGEDPMEVVRARIRDYGKLFNKEELATDLTNKLDAKLEETKSAVAGKGTGMILMTNGPKIAVYGEASRFGWLHSALDLPQASPSNASGGNHGEAISFEFLAKADPDWILVIDRAAAIGSNEQSAKATLDNALVHNTKAWKRNQIVYLPSQHLYIAAGGVSATTKVLDTIIQSFSK